MEERYLPEREGILNSKTTSMSGGSLRKIIGIGFCDFCTQRLKEGEISLCSSCRKKLCLSCIVMISNKSHCRDCAKKMIALTKEDFFVLYGTANKASLKEVKRAGGLTSDCLRESVEVLLERGFIEAEGLSIFTHYTVTSQGLAVLTTCEQIYHNEGDVSRFLLEIQELLSEV